MIINMSLMVDQYFDIYNEKTNEFGENTVVLFACGSFWEMYEIDNEKERIGNARKLSKILDMVYANKLGDITKNSRTHPNFIGFTKSILDKYLGVLLRNGYTVVLVDQLELSSEKKGKLVKRGITKIISPTLQSTDYINDFNLVSLLFDIKQPIKKSQKINSSMIQTMKISICCINNNNNTIEIIENDLTFLPNNLYTLNLTLEDISRTLYGFNPKELQITFTSELYNEEIKTYFNENYENIRYNSIIEKTDIIEQNQYLRDVWNHISFGVISPVEYFNLKELSVCNLILILKFIEKHDVSYIKNLSIPKMIEEHNLRIKNMVCPRCLQSVDTILRSLAVSFSSISLGEVELKKPLHPLQ